MKNQSPKKRSYGKNSNGMSSYGRKQKKNKIINISVLAASIILLFSGIFMVYADHLLGRINFQTDPEVSSSQPESSYKELPSGVIGTPESVDPSKPTLLNGLYHDNQIFNVLVIGVDDYEANDIGRSDSMMMVSVDDRHKKLKMTSYMRDMYVSIPGYKAQKLNAAYSLGGPTLTVRTIENNFGVDIDNYVLVDNDAFNKIVDRMGGVDLEITQAEANLVNRYSGESSSKRLSGGTVHMTGRQAHYYSRIRAIGDDFERTLRQRKVIESLINKFKTSNLLEINGILYDTLPMVKTNMTKNEILSKAVNALTYLNYETAQFRIPADNTYDENNVSGVGSVLIPNIEENHQQLIEFVFEDDVPENSMD